MVGDADERGSEEDVGQGVDCTVSVSFGPLFGHKWPQKIADLGDYLALPLRELGVFASAFADPSCIQRLIHMWRLEEHFEDGL